MLTRISWRNVWRNKVRSLILVSSIAMGIWAGIFMLSFSWGMSIQYVNMGIKGQVSHIQLHHPLFKEDRKIKFTIPGAPAILDEINALETVKAATGRVIVGGMVSSPTAGAGANVTGIDPDQENKVTGIGDNIIEGEYFDSDKQNQILIGEKLAQKLKVKLRNKVVLTVQDTDGNITAGAFRISGIYRTSNSSLDELNVYVRDTDISRLLGLDTDQIQEIALLLQDNTDLAATYEGLQSKYPGLLVEDWKTLAPELRIVIDSFSQTMYLFMSIILLALTFGIINTMLMAVLERIHELGILMAIGMNKLSVFLMIMLETLYLAIIGGICGLLLAYGSIQLLSNTGIDLSAFATGLSSYGMDTMVYPAFPDKQFLEIFIMIFIAAVLSAIYPAYKALKLNPVQAIRKI
jgi:ABC-type lipoprotein release transport system permease subunit